MREREIQPELAHADGDQRGQVARDAADVAGRAPPAAMATVAPDSTARPSANHNGVLPDSSAILVSGQALLSRITDAASWIKPAAGSCFPPSNEAAIRGTQHVNRTRHQKQ